MTLLLAISLVAGVKAGNASRYGYEGDIYDRVGSFACKRRLEARFGAKQWEKMRKSGVAHRTLPCGTRIGLCLARTGLCTPAYVVDRGPWGVLDRKGEWHARTGRLLPGEHYRGELDLLPGTYTSIGLVGIEKVLFWPISEAGAEMFFQEEPRVVYPPLRPADKGPTRKYPRIRLFSMVSTQLLPPLQLGGNTKSLAALQVGTVLAASGPQISSGFAGSRR